MFVLDDALVYVLTNDAQNDGNHFSSEFKHTCRCLLPNQKMVVRDGKTTSFGVTISYLTLSIQED